MSGYWLPSIFFICFVVLAWELYRSLRTGRTMFEGFLGNLRSSQSNYKIGVTLNVVWLVLSLWAFVGSLVDR